MTEAVNNAEELEAACKLYFMLQGHDIRYLNNSEVEELRK